MIITAIRLRSYKRSLTTPCLLPTTTMPVTFSPAPHNAKPVSLKHLPEGGYMPAGLLAQSCLQQHEAAKEFLQFGLSGLHEGTGGYVFSPPTY
jgi:hypothetical protein